MKKQEFLKTLAARLAGLSANDVDRSLEYYSEIIDDRMEEGLAEEDAVAAMGPLDDCVAQIRVTLPTPAWTSSTDGQMADSLPDKKPSFRRLKGWEILLLIIGSPIWIPLLLALGAVVLSLYIALWAVVIVVYSLEIAFAAGALGGIFGAGTLLFTGAPTQALLYLGGGFVFVGLTILLFFGVGKITHGAVTLCKGSVRAVRHCFGRKEKAV